MNVRASLTHKKLSRSSDLFAVYQQNLINSSILESILLIFNVIQTQYVG